MKCIICGCTDKSACSPPCSWAAPFLCSHCADPDKFKRVLRPARNVLSAEIPAAGQLCSALNRIHIPTTWVPVDGGNNIFIIYFGNLRRLSLPGEREAFDKMIKCWFPNAELAKNAYQVCLNETAPKLELAAIRNEKL